MTDKYSVLNLKSCAPSVRVLLAVFLLVILPIVMFGQPGFYGDDFNLRGAIDQRGLIGAVRHWIDHYGAGYRPGMVISFGLYDMIGDRPSMFYFINITAFMAVAAATYHMLSMLTDDRMLALFVGAFVALFPLSSTAYLQLSSICMFLAILIVVQLTGKVLTSSQYYETWSRAWQVTALWVLVLLIYEQPIGLYAFFAIALIAAARAGTLGHSYAAVFRLGIALTLGTAFFLAGYLMNSGNPKIVSLKMINSQNTVVVSPPLPVGEGRALQAASIVNQPAPTETASQIAPSPNQKSRAAMLATFFGHNAIYAAQHMAESMWVIGAFIAILIFAGVPIYRIKVVPVTPRVSLAYIAFGSLWAILSVLPFFLYGRFTAPPYVFVLPSIGMGVASYGIYWTIWRPARGMRYGTVVLKPLVMAMIVLFALQQYGYFFGLRDELLYSRSIAQRLQPYKQALLDGTVLHLTGLPVKSNAHIFWLEKAVGYRAFFTAMGDEFAGIEMRWRAADSLEISIPKRLPSRPTTIVVSD